MEYMPPASVGAPDTSASLPGLIKRYGVPPGLSPEEKFEHWRTWYGSAIDTPVRLEKIEKLVRPSFNPTSLSLDGPEALIRMESIWQAWEHLRLEPAVGVSTWWLNHADPHMRVLMDKEGPFKKCAYDGHKSPPAEKAVLRHVVPEAGIFD